MTGFESGLNEIQLARKIAEATSTPESAKALYEKYNVAYNESGINYSTLVDSIVNDYVENDTTGMEAVDREAYSFAAATYANGFHDGSIDPNNWDEDGFPKNTDPEPTPDPQPDPEPDPESEPEPDDPGDDDGGDEPEQSSLPADTELTRNATSDETNNITNKVMQEMTVVDPSGRIDPEALGDKSTKDVEKAVDDYFEKHADELPENVNVDDLKARVKTAATDARDNAKMYNEDPDEEKGEFKPYEGVDFNSKDPEYDTPPDEGNESINNDDPSTPEKDKGKGQGVNDLHQVQVDGKGTKVWVWKDDKGNVHQSTKKPDVPAAETDPSTTDDPSSTGDTAEPQQQVDPDAGLTTFERVGIKADRHLATRPASEWKHSPAVTDDPPQKFDCLAEAINFSLREELQTPKGKDKQSQLDRGFTNRAVPEYLDKNFLDQVVEMAFETSGAGGTESQIAQVFASHDRFSRSLAPKNAVFSGFTFFTRPRLCLRDWNICHDRKLSVLMTQDTRSIDFAIRCLLDTRFAAENENAGKCKLFDKGNPFNVPLCNAVRSVTGFNDPMLVTETTEGGFFSEDQTYVIGGDRMARTYDINCMFRDYPGSPILALIDFWTQYMAGLTDGSIQQYADAIDLNRMDYTVSIYRFLMDRTQRNIVRWAKCTGCYPVSPPSGVCFNLNESEFMVEAASSINVPFKANRIEYDDPVILKEFNMLVRRYCGEDTGLTAGLNSADSKFVAGFSHNVASNNFAGIPYIRMSPTGGYELIWLRRDKVGEYIYGYPGVMTGIRADAKYRENGVEYRGSGSEDSDQDVRFFI